MLLWSFCTRLPTGTSFGLYALTDLISLRNGSLATSSLAQPYEAGHYSHKKLIAYSKARLLTSEAVLLGVNVNHDDLLNYASQQSVIGEGKASGAPESPYIGGDARQFGPSSVAHVLIAGEGAPCTDSKALATQYVLAALMGSRRQSFLIPPLILKFRTWLEIH